MTQTIGQKLKNAREEKRLTLEKVFEDIRIRIQYLQALEEDDLSIMPSPVQARGYLRNYAQYLDLDFNQLLNELRAEIQTTDEIIGPADDASTLRPSLQLPGDVIVNSRPESHSIDPILTQDAKESVEEVPPPSAPSLVLPDITRPGRPVRRKKVDSQPNLDSVQPPKRRGRKKAETEPEAISVVEATPDLIEEPVGSADSVTNETESPVVEETPVEPLQAEPQPDISDSLWQTWLNRLGSVLSARGRRPTLVPKESAISEIESDSVSLELNVAPG